MRGWLLITPVMLPLLAAAVSLALSRFRRVQRLLGVVVLTAVLADCSALLVLADRHGPQVLAVGGWRAPIGITLVADRLSALLLTVAVAVALAVLLFAIGQGVADEGGAPSLAFHPAYLFLTGGVGLAFLSGDLFNLFVAFELMLASSYVLITLGAGAGRLQAGMTYTITSLTSSLLFLSTIALTYAATGTVDLADLSGQLARVPDGVRSVLSLLLLTVFGIKAAVVPLHFWLPDSYPTAPAPITAVFAALLTKVGVYAMVRTQTLLFPRTEVWTLLAVAAVVAMLVGVLGALAQDDINRLLSFVLVSHIGYMLFGLALFTVGGLTGTVLYTVHHITVQAALFLVAGVTVSMTGTPALRRMRRMAPPPTTIAVLFLLPALSLAGVPPLSGFVAKLALLRAGAADPAPVVPALVAAALLTSLLTLYAMARVWRYAYASGATRTVERPGRGTVLMRTASVGLVLVGLALVVCAGPLAELSERAAVDLVERDSYRNAVLREGQP